MTANLWARWICCICLPHAKLGLAMSVIAPSRRVLCLFAVAILTSGIAAADTIVATGVDGALSESSLWIDENGTDTSEIAGVIYIQLTDSSGTVDRDTMCVDLFTNIYLNQTYNTTVDLPSQVPPPQNPAYLERIAWLEDNALLPVLFPGDPSTLPSADWSATQAQAAGLQLAIWDIVVDGGDGYLQRSSAGVDWNNQSDRSNHAFLGGDLRVRERGPDFQRRLCL